MPTTARGIWTPSDTDAVDFTTHLATMAGTIDTAITNGLNTIGAGANAFKGTAAQRAAFLSTAVNGMLWQDTDSIKMIWRKDGAAWVPAVWRWSGTTAQMNAFAAPNGFEWFNTTNNSDYVRLGGAWDFAPGLSGTITPASGYTNTGSRVSRIGPLIVANVKTTRVSTQTTNGAAWFTLPVDFRPSVQIEGTALTSGGTGGANTQLAQIGANGVCAMWFITVPPGGTATTQSVSIAFLAT